MEFLFHNKKYFIGLIVIALGFLSGSVTYAFNPPVQPPPNGTAALFTDPSGGLGIATTSFYSNQSQWVFKTQGGANQHIVFFPNGNVGIQTAAPAYTLDVNGDIRGNNIYANSFIGGISGSISAANITGPAVFGSNIGTYTYAFPAALGIGTNLLGGSLPVNGLYVSGKVGIGANVPTGQLSVALTDDTTPGTITVFDGRHAEFGTTAQGVALSYSATNNTGYISAVQPNVGWKNLAIQAARFDFNPSGGASSVFRIENGGNVGIGTIPPNYKLDVGGDINVVGTAAYRRGGTVGISVSCPSGTTIATTTVSGGIITGGNCVPLSTGALTGNGVATYFPYWTGALTLSSTSTIYQAAGGNVGFGTISPSEQLEISRNFEIPVTTANTGIIKMGIDSFIHAYGPVDGYSGVGQSNAFLGSRAGNFTMTGGGNIGIGVNALRQNTSGNANVAVGPNALSVNTIGVGNIAVGSIALALNTSGGGNTALGDTALFRNMTGSQNTAIGQYGLQKITTAVSNTAVGYQSMSGKTSGDWNVALGVSSAFYNNGTDNVAIGVNALSYNNAGNRNTAVGNNAGNGNSTSTTSGSRNVFVGYGAGYYETGSDKLYVANGTFGVNTLLYGDFATGRLGVNVGTSTPGYTLDVGGDVNVIPTAVYRRGGVAGLSVACPVGQVLATTTVSGGIVTGGTCVNVAATTINMDALKVSSGGQSVSQPTGLNSITMGGLTSGNGDYSFVGGYSSVGNNANRSFGFGDSVILAPSLTNYSGEVALGSNLTVDGARSKAIGSFITAGGIGVTNAMVFGSGVSDGVRLVNTNTNSIMFGTNSDIPTVYIGPSSGAATVGNVGIGGVTNPNAQLEINGGVRLNTAIAKPTCNASVRGEFWVTQNGAGVKDNVEVCAKDAANAYAWRTLY